MERKEQACPLPTVRRIHKDVIRVFPCKRYATGIYDELKCRSYEQCPAYKAYMTGENDYNVLSEIYKKNRK